MLTAFMNDKERKKAAELGVTMILEKPIEAEVLKAILRKLMVIA